MASQDALWAKLWELELQLAAYKLLHAPRPARWEEEEEDVGGRAGGVVCCRGRQYDAYMRRRDARRASVTAAEGAKRQPKLSSRPSPLTVKCASRDTQTQQQQQARRATASIPRKEPRPLLPRSRTLSSGAAAAPPTPVARSQPHHQRRNSVGGEVLGDTPRPFLRRGSGTGGAAAMRSPRVHEYLPPSDTPSSSPSPRRPRPRDHFVAQVAGAAPAGPGRHLRSVSELPFHYATGAATEFPGPVETPPPAQARARKRWGDVESPPSTAMFSAAATNPHMDLAKGLRKLLSYVRKSKSSAETRSGADGKPVMKGWAATACSVLDGPLDRASLEGHRFPMTRAVGTSG